MNSNDIGNRFEERVTKMFRMLGKKNIRRNVLLADSRGHRSEIDITFGRVVKTYVECKFYSSQPVPLKDVAKFKEVLLQNKIPVSAGLFVTNSTYVPRAYGVGIRLVDGVELEKWESRGIRRFYFSRPASRALALFALGVPAFMWYYASEESKIMVFDSDFARGVREWIAK
eukprot:g1206.t1